MRLINYARQERQQQQKQEATRTSRPCGKWWKVSTSRRFCDGNCWMSWRLGGIVKPIFVRFVLIYVHGTICFAFRAVLQQWEPIKLVYIHIFIDSQSPVQVTVRFGFRLNWGACHGNMRIIWLPINRILFFTFFFLLFLLLIFISAKKHTLSVNMRVGI